MSSTETAKLLKDVEKFSGKDGEDAEEFLESLDEKVLQGRMYDTEILGAVSNVLKTKRADGGVPSARMLKLGWTSSFNCVV